MHRLPAELDAPLFELVEPVESSGSLGPAAVHQPGKAQDLALVQLEGDVRHLARRYAVGLQHHHVVRLAALFRVHLVHLVAEHVADELLLRQALVAQDGYELTVPHHGDPVADLEDLLQPVRNVDHRNVQLLELLDDAEKDLHLTVREHRRGLVPDEDLRPAKQDLHYRHELTQGCTQFAHLLLRPQRDLISVQHLLDRLLEPAPVHKALARILRIADDHVLRHRELRDELRLLIHLRDAQPLRHLRARDRHVLALEPYLP